MVCVDIKKYMWDLFPYYKRLWEMSEEEMQTFLSLLEKKWYTLESFLDEVSKKFPETKDYNDYVAKWYEMSKMMKSNMYAYINKNIKKNMVENTKKMIEKIINEKDKIKREQYIKELQKNIKRWDDVANLFDELVTDISLSKEEKQELTKLFYWDTELEKLLQDKDIRWLQNYYKNLDKKAAQYDLENADAALTTLNSHTYFLEKVKDKIFFADKTTVERNTKRIYKDWFRDFSNLYDIRNESKFKYWDILNQLRKENKTEEYNISEILNQINQQRWTNYKFVWFVNKDTALLQDSEWNVFVVNTWMFQQDIDTIINYFSADIGWEYWMKDFTHAKEITKNKFWEDIANNISDVEKVAYIEEQYKELKKRFDEWKLWDLTKEEVQELISWLEKEADSLIEDNLIRYTELVHKFPEYITGKLEHRFWENVLSTFWINSYLVNLLSNIELIEEYSPELATMIKKILRVNETKVKDLQIDLLKKLNTLITENPKIVDEIEQYEPMMVVLDTLQKRIKNLETDKWIKLEDEFYMYYQKELLNLDNYEDKLIKFKNYINQYLENIGKWDYKITDEQIMVQRNLFERSKNAFSKEWYVWYAFLKYWIDTSIRVPFKYKIKTDLQVITREFVKAYPKLDENILYDKIIDIFSKNKNLIVWFNNLRSTFEPFDKAYQESVWSQYSLIDILLQKAWMNENNIKRIKGDLYWKSVFWDNKWYEVIWIIRDIYYKTSMTLFGGKGLSIAFQNLYTIPESLSLYQIKNPWQYKEFLNILNELNNQKIKKKLEQEIFSPLENEIIKYSENNKLTWDIRIANKFNLWLYKILKKFNLNSLADAVLNKKLVQQLNWVIFNPAGVVDELAKKTFVKDKIFDYVLNDAWIDMNELKLLVDKANKWDLEALATINKLIDDANEKALVEYTRLYKVAYHAGLTRNSFSRHIFLNIFSSWWSKKFASYMTDIFITPIRDAATIYRITWSTKAATASLFSSLVKSKRLQAILKQLYMASFLIYNIHKDTEVDWDEVKAIKEALIPFQAFQSFVLTRAIGKAIDYWLIAYKDDADFWKTLLWTLHWFWQAVFSNFMKDVKYFWQLVWQPAIYLAMWKDDQAIYTFFYNLVNAANTTLSYNMFDQYKWVYTTRFDSKTRLWLLEWALWFPLTKWWEEKWDLVNENKYKEFLKKWMSSIVKDYKLSFLWSYYAASYSYKFTKLWQQLDSDVDFKIMKETWEIPDSLLEDDKSINKLYNFITKSDYLQWWNLEWWTTEWQWKLWLIFNELQEKWYDLNKLIVIVNSSLIKWDTQTALKLLAWLDTKAGATMITAYMAQKEYQSLVNNLKTSLWVKKISDIPQDTLRQIKVNIIKKYLPVLEWLDKHLHSKVSWYYIQKTYWDNKDLYTNDIKKDMELELFAELIDLQKTDFNNQLFTSIPAKLLRDTDKENFQPMLDRLWNLIDNLWVSSTTKTIAKTALLYANLNKVKDLLLSNPDKYWPYVNKLADLIWETDKRIQANPEILEWLFSNNTKVKPNRFGLVDTKPAKLARHIKKEISKLKELTLKLPTYKPKAFSKIKYSVYNPKTLKTNIKIDANKIWIRREKLKPINPGQLRTEILRTREKYIKAKRARKPKTKPVGKTYKKTKPNKATRTKIKPSRVNR